MTMRQIAQYSYNNEKELSGITYEKSPSSDFFAFILFDARIGFVFSAIKGCLCHRAISIDNQYPIDYTTFTSVREYNATSMNQTVLYDDRDRTRFFRGPYAFAASDFKGFACQEALCPKGDDPLTTGGTMFFRQ